MNIKKGDTVAVIAGKDKSKVGKVVATFPKNEKVIVENVNIVSKHKKPRSAQDKGGIVKKSNPIDVSNVMIVCPVCGKLTRIAHKELEGKKARVCKKCGASLDKAMAKAVKKDAKATKTVKEPVEAKVEEVKPVEKKTAAKKTTTTKATTTAKTTKTTKSAVKTAKSEE